jgi:hypothetical protein
MRLTKAEKAEQAKEQEYIKKFNAAVEYLKKENKFSAENLKAELKRQGLTRNDRLSAMLFMQAIAA